MKTLVLACSAAFVAAVSFAAEPTPDAPAAKPLDAKLERVLRDALPVCPDTKLSQAALQHKLPAGMTGSLVRVQSPRATCEGQFLSVTTQGGDFFLGVPWFLDGAEGKTLEEKLTNFAWKALNENFKPVIDRTRTRNGLYKVTMNETTERGTLPMEGEIDPEGTVFFLGHFHGMTDNMNAARTKVFEPFFANAPSKGAAKPDVTVVEFSDFECPSCRHAAGYLDPIMAKHADRVRYVRIDLPLMSMHPWAFAAAMAGRAINRQKPELFWDFKKYVYEHQDSLTAFTFDDFARGFAQDHDLDLKRYDADIASEEVRNEILRGAGAAFSNDIRATPSYMVNGAVVDPGEDGSALAAYVEKLLAK